MTGGGCLEKPYGGWGISIDHSRSTHPAVAKNGRISIHPTVVHGPIINIKHIPILTDFWTANLTRLRKMKIYSPGMKVVKNVPGEFVVICDQFDSLLGEPFEDVRMAFKRNKIWLFMRHEIDDGSGSDLI